MKIKICQSDAEYKKTFEWHKWFAWHPVMLGDSGIMVWLNTIERRRDQTFIWYAYWIYREIGVE